MKLYFASGNEHKKAELSRLLGGYELVIPKEEGIPFDPVEDGTSFIENATIKAEALYSIVHQPVIADDLGKEIQQSAAASDDLPVVLYREACIEIRIAPEPVRDEIIIELVIREYLAVGCE